MNRDNGKGIQSVSSVNYSLITPDELVSLLKVPKKTIYRWVSQARIPFIKLGRHLRFDPNAVLTYFKERSGQQMKPCTPSFDLLIASHSSPLEGKRCLKNETAAKSSSLKGD